MKNEYLAKQPLKQEEPAVDVARTATWLMSDYSLGVTGQIVNGKLSMCLILFLVDGGYSIL